MPVKTITQIKAANDLGNAQVGDYFPGNRGVGNTGGLTYAPKLSMDTNPTLANNLNLNGNNITAANGTNLLGALPQALAVNYFAVGNAITTNYPSMFAVGSDSNVSYGMFTKGTGSFAFNTQNASTAIVLSSGTGYQHVTNFNFSNTAATRTVTFPDATGTVAFNATNLTIPIILDTNGNNELAFTATASAVNYFTIINAAAASNPTITATGSDTNINGTFQGKGTGFPVLATANTTTGFATISGTSYQHVTNFNFSNTSNTRTLTFPDVTDTVLTQTSPTITTPTINGFTNASSATAGVVGEKLQTAFTTTGGLTSTVAANIVSLNLTAGDWDVWAEGNSVPAAGTTTQRFIISLNTVSASIPAPPTTIALSSTAEIGAATAAGLGITLTTSPLVVSINATTTYYLNVFAQFAGSTMTASGVITARRRR